MFKEILKKIKKYQRIIIYGHVRPDGDCYGAGSGYKTSLKMHFLKKMYL